ncbi:MAG TPA: tetratricopeptide repeat protein [Candidatus Acidoferrales bacterium]|nr:tetratricopeptide repeat protein [Candidatus Acidoferrales bacterium]
MNFQNHCQRIVFTACAGIFLAARILAADTNGVAAVTRDEMTSNYLQIQEQLRAAQIAIEQNQEAALATSQSNALALAQRLQSLEQTVGRQRESDAAAAHKTQELTLLMAGAFGLMGLGIMLLMVYFQWRAFTQLAQISSRQSAAISNSDAVHQLAAPGRATVEASTAQLLSAVGRLEQRISELESGQRLLPEIANVKPADFLAEGQKYLDANVPLKALECFDKFLGSQPTSAEAMLKRAVALEKLGRDDEALAGYNRAIAAEPSLVIAHLHKGGLLNRLRRYDEALNCYEQALLGQEKKAGG